MADSKDILTFVVGTAAALLGAILSLLAILPIILQLIADRIPAFFAAGREKARLRYMFVTLIVTAGILVLVILVGCASVLMPSFQGAAGYIGIYLVILSLAGCSIIIALATFILRAVFQGE